MTALIALIRKDIILYRSNRRALLLNLALPIILAAFFGSLFGGSGSATAGKVDVGLVQLDPGATTSKIVNGLKAQTSLNVVELSLVDAQAKVRSGKLPVAIVLPQDFGAQADRALFNPRNKPAIELLYDPSQATTLAMVKGMLTQQVMQTVSADVFGGGAGSAQFAEQARKDLATSTLQGPERDAINTLLDSAAKLQAARADKQRDGGASSDGGGLSMPFTTSDSAVSSGPKYNGYAHSFAGMSVQFILFMGIDMGISILLAHRLGIWNRLLAAPVTLTTVLLARALSAALIAMGLLCVIFFVAVVAFHVQIASLSGFLLVALGFALMTASFGLLIAAFGKTPETARGIASFATLIMVMLSGAWIPSFVFPDWVRKLTVVVPTRWAVDGFDAVTWRGMGVDAAVMPLLVQLSFALAFVALAIWKFRSDQD